MIEKFTKIQYAEFVKSHIEWLQANSPEKMEQLQIIELLDISVEKFFPEPNPPQRLRLKYNVDLDSDFYLTKNSVYKIEAFEHRPRDGYTYAVIKAADGTEVILKPELYELI